MPYIETKKKYGVKEFKVYEYPLDKKGTKGSYTIFKEVKPLGLKGETLVGTFQARVLIK